MVVSASLNPGSFSNQNADWWVAKDGPDGWYYYDVLGGSWRFQPGLSLTYQRPLFELGSTDVWVGAELSSGTHTFYFGVDRVMDGLLTYEALTYDSISILVAE